MYGDYVSQILKVYQDKKATNDISLFLGRPTPANLKDACIEVYRTRPDRKDEMVLKTFFGQDLEMNSFLQAVKKCDIDKFRPLVNFLRKPTIDTHDKNIELLAWLIDFKPRPFEVWEKHNSNSLKVLDIQPIKKSNEEEDNKTGEIQPEQTRKEAKPEGVTTSSRIISEKRNNRFEGKKTVMAVLILIPLSILGYWLLSNRTQGCMYWAGDHYQQISCGQKPANAMVIALDEEKLNNLKKITAPDSITKKSIGKVWYTKINDTTLEFYTSAGFHPTDYDRRLLPITDYIIKKYIRKN